VAVELIVPGITSPFLERSMGEALLPRVLEEPHVQYAQLWCRGYLVLDLDAERVRATFVHFEGVEQVKRASSRESVAVEVRAGERRLRVL